MILLDTNALIWLAQDLPLSQLAERSIDEAAAARGILVSAVSAWEVGNLMRRGRLKSPLSIPDWFERAASKLGFQTVDLTAEIALASTELDWSHRDPADRFLVATARSLNVPIVTGDREILAYAAAGHVRAVAC